MGVGFTLVYRSSRVLNLAHGAVVHAARGASGCGVRHLNDAPSEPRRRHSSLRLEPPITVHNRNLHPTGSLHDKTSHAH